MGKAYVYAARILWLLMSLAVLYGCATPDGRFGATPGFGQKVEVDASQDWQTANLVDVDSPTAESDDPILVRGTDRMMASPRTQQEFSISGEAVSLQFEQAPLGEVVHAVFGDILGLPYVISEPVAGEITLRTARPIERDQILNVLETVLSAKGLAVVRDPSGIFHIGTPGALRDVAPSISLFTRDVPGQHMVVVPLEFIGAAEMADLLAPVAKPEALVRVDGFRNLLILAGNRNQIEGWLDIVRIFDVDVLKGLSVGLFPLEHISVKEAEAAFSLLFSEVGIGGQSDGDGARAVGGPLGSVVRFVGIERLNAILVVTPRAYYLKQVQDWVEIFDVPHYNSDEPRLFVYPVQNGTASHLAAMLSALFGGGAPSPAAALDRVDSGVAPGLETAGMSARGTGDGAGGPPASTPRRDTPPSASGNVSGIGLDGDVRVIADEQSNSILIYSTGGKYQKIEAALRRLDTAPRQILIEASIIEVTLTDELQYGLQWFFQGGLGSRYQGEGLLNLRAEGGIGPTQPGFSYTVRNPIGDVRAVLNALADKSLVNVISSPSVLVVDNHTAIINVGDQQPVRTATTITDGGVTTSSIQFKDTGVMLSVTPSVNAGGMVSLDIDQNVTDVGAIDSATNQRSFLQRQISSRVAVRSGETVVLGGLIRDNQSTGRQGIPGLHDVPLLGNLFGATSRSRTRTELLVMLTPRMLETEEDLRGIGEELRRKMPRVEGLLLDMVASDELPDGQSPSRAESVQ